MACRLLSRSGMSTLALLLALLAAPLAAFAQDAAPTAGAVIESADVTGFPLDQLSPGLQQDIAALAGQPLDRERLDALAARIESEQPDVVAAVRDVVQSDGRVRVVFLVGRISDNEHLSENINARYVVEHVAVTGIPDRQIAQELLDELQALVGHPLDPIEADRLVRRLEAELPDHDVRRRIRRGEQSGQIRVVFEVARSERSRWLRFPPSRSKLVYHEDHGWSGVLDVPFGGRRSSQVNLGFVFGNDDDLIEEYSGFRLRVENRKAGSDRLGVGFELSRFSQDWRDVTLAALDATPGLAQPYRTRTTFEPTVTFAITPRMRVSAGVSTSDLKPLDTGLESEHAHAFVTSVGYDQTWKRDGDGEQAVGATYSFRAGTSDLDSDLSYRRHVAHGRFRTDRGETSFVADFRAGRISGRAPLFERFTVGDSTTLRGWNKFDLTPAGADRMWHQSIELSHDWLTYFFDAGSIWTSGTTRKVRLATGFGVGPLFLGFPLNSDNGNVTFMLHVRFGAGVGF